MQKTFFISGLGANELAFSKIGALGCEKIMVKWIPHVKNETLEAYAVRLVQQYEINGNDIIAGLSFGGLLAQEISNITGLQTVILISSFRDKNDLKLPYRMALNNGLYNLLPPVKTPYVDELIANMLNSGTAGSKPVLKEMIQSTDYNLMKWSLRQIAKASGNTDKNVILHNIIGDRDRIVNLWRNDTTYVVKGGSHFMVYDRAEEITEIIRSIITSATTLNILKHAL